MARWRVRLVLWVHVGGVVGAVGVVETMQNTMQIPGVVLLAVAWVGGTIAWAALAERGRRRPRTRGGE
jgi:hypothetical protein